MAGVIRLPLLGLYLALVLPLAPLAPEELRAPLLLATVLGFGLVLAITSERVELDGSGIRVGHPAWCAWLLRRGWSLPWSAISGLTPVATSQGGRVYYLRTRSGSGFGAAYLLPQRVSRFADFLERFEHASGVPCDGVGRITPPWTYQLLGWIVALLLAGELIVLTVLRP